MSRAPTGSTADAIALHRDDQVATALKPLTAGSTVQVQTPDGTREITLGDAVPICHKLALADIRSGDPVRKYGEVIGAATADIAAGAHVHTHNIVSRRAGGGRPGASPG